MGFRFFRRIGIAPGVGLNLGAHGASVSVGPRGLKLTFSPRGVRANIGVPGTGISYSVPLVTRGKRKHANPAARNSTPPAARATHAKPVSPATPIPQSPQSTQVAESVQDHQRIVPIEPSAHADTQPQPANAFDQAVSLDQHGDFIGAFASLSAKRDDPAAQFGAAAIAFKNRQYDSALECAMRAHGLFDRGITSHEDRFTVTLSITEEIALELAPGKESAVLLTAELLEATHQYDKAISILRESLQRYGDDSVVKLSLVELLYDTSTCDDQLQEVVQLARRVEPTDLATIGLLLYKARALARLGMHEGIPALLLPIVEAGDPLPAELALALRYELGRAHQELNQPDKARAHYHHIYAIDSEYEDVAERLKNKA